MNHGLESHIHLSASDDLGDIARVVRFEDRNLDALVGEEAKLLGKVKGCVVRRGLPVKEELSQSSVGEKGKTK
jgi:hypothetical protein